jgi:branched-chain amino acid transport system permease protein
VAAGAAWLVLGPEAPMTAQIAVTLVVVAPLGPVLYRLAFAPLANASVLVLLMVAVAVHFVLVGLGLIAFGAEGARTPPLFADNIIFGGVILSQQALFVVAAAAALMVAMGFFFGRTLQGKALRATAMNRVGARIVGIPTASAGVLAFLLAGLIGAVSGVLIAPITTIYYDTGFLIGLKGFMAAIVGGMGSYALAVAGALAIGGFETVSSFYASAYKEAIIFALIIPILVWRSLTTRHVEEDEE